MHTQTIRSFCRVCTSLCGILIDTEGEQVVRVRGDHDHPISRGYTCPKGRALPQMHHHKDRLEQPLIRINGVQSATDWDQCLDDLAAKLRDIIAKYGPAAVGIYFGSGIGMDAAAYAMAGTLHGAIGTPAKFSPLTIDGTAKVLVASLVGGFPGLNARTDYDHAKLLIYIGANPVVSHGHAIAMPLPPPKTIRAVRDRGEVWVIDPRKTETVAFASHHLAPQPGTDYAILAYLVRSLLDEKMGVDLPVVLLQDCEAIRAAVQDFDLSRTATTTGLSADELEQLLASLRHFGRLAIETGTGVTMSATANITQWLAWVLMALTDSMNRPGGVWFHPGCLTRMDNFELPDLPAEMIFTPGPSSCPDLPGFLGEWPGAALADEIKAGNIKAFLNLGGNLLTAFPDTNALRPALASLDVLASLDIIQNDTTALSSHVLPTKDQLERPDITLWDFLSSRVSAQYTPAVIDAVAGRRSTWWILAELLRRMGYEESSVASNGDGRDVAVDNARLVGLVAHGRCDFADLAERGYREFPLEFPAPWVDEHIVRIGGWRLAPPQLVEQLQQQLKSAQASAVGSLPLRLIPRRQKRHVNAQFLYLGDTAELIMNPLDAAQANVLAGDSIVVRSKQGEITAVARLDEDICQGVVSMPHGHENANVNLLTDASQADRLTGMALYSGIEVSVNRL